MNLKVYNGEKFERSRRWYVGFSIIIIAIIILSLFKKNVVGAVVLFFILGAYFYYTLISHQIITIKINERYITLDKKNFPWNDFTGYAIEADKKTETIKNIVFVSSKGHIIYTIDDTKDHMELFFKELGNYLPMLGEYHQSFLEKTARILKL